MFHPLAVGHNIGLVGETTARGRARWLRESRPKGSRGRDGDAVTRTNGAAQLFCRGDSARCGGAESGGRLSRSQGFTTELARLLGGNPMNGIRGGGEANDPRGSSWGATG